MAKVTTYASPNKQPTGQFVQPTPRYNYDHDWRLERQLLQQEFTDITMSVMLAGGEAGADAMPPGLDVLVDWDVFNQDALDWMRQYLSVSPAMAGDLGQGAYGWVSQLTDTTKRGFEREVNDWIMEGASLKVLESRLRPLFGADRARRVAVTEVTRIYAAGNEKAWKASGVVSGKRWMTAVDERVCPVCGPLHNTIVGIDDSWNFTPEMLAANPQLARALKSIGTVFRLPPAHVNCRCWLQPVIFEAMTEEEIAADSFDKGPVVVQPVSRQINAPFTGPQIRKRLGELKGVEGELNVLIDETRKNIRTMRALNSRIPIPRNQVDGVLSPSQERAKARTVTRIEKLSAQNEITEKKIQEMERRANEKTSAIMNFSTSGGLVGRFRGSSNKYAQSGIDKFNSLVAPGVAPDWVNVFVSKTQKRAAYHAVSRTVTLPEVTGEKAVVHELGHLLELKNPSVKREAEAFYRRRTEGQSPERLNKLTNLPYRDDEVAIPDEFINPYMGKVMPERNGTEIISFGLDLMATEPARFAREDPDMFDFVFKTMRGQ